MMPVTAGVTQADDGWNPFAEKERRAAERAVEQRRQQQQALPANDTSRTPYLAPISPGDRPAGYAYQPPQPYPATPPGYAAGTPYQPPGGAPPAQPGATNFGAPGTYLAAPANNGGGIGTAAPQVERGELTPVISSQGALPEGTWQGLDAAGAEQLLGAASLPPASPTLNELFGRIMIEPVGETRLDALRLAALLKAGHFDRAAMLQAKALGAQNPAGGASEPVENLLRGKLDLITAKTERGCRLVKKAVAAQGSLPKHTRGEAVVMAGYCAIIGGNRQAGSLAAELARDAGYKRPFTLSILEAIASGDSVRAPLPADVTALDGLLAGQLKRPDPALIGGMLDRAAPGFLHLIAADDNAPGGLRLKAAERAAVANIIAPATLANAYRAAAGNPGAGASSAALERAAHFLTAERQQAQFTKTRSIRNFLDSARRDGLYQVAAMVMAPIVRSMRPAQEISWFAETAVEVLVAGGDYQAARQWVRSATLAPRSASGGSLDHWLMLIDIADPEVADGNRGRSIGVLENLALQGRFAQPALHRLATVLDALDYNVPVPLWNLASRSEQPQSGYLPATGILSAMKQASEERHIAATALYALRTISPKGTPATHLLGLGETIRALKRAGLEKDARRLGFETLFGDWPRTSGR
jgi:hypothetical protein